MRRASWLAVLVAASVTACGPERSEHPRVVRILQDDAVFLHRSDAETAKAMDQLVELNFHWLRVTAGWSVIERSPGRWEEAAWAPLDRAVRLARERRLGVNIDIAFWAPPHAVPRSLGDRERERFRPDPQAYARFAGQVAHRYPEADAFTVWNEPNHHGFLLPQWERRNGRWVPASPRVYREMLRAAVPEIRRGAPDALVLIGATSSVGTSQGRSADDRMAPLPFLRELACVDGELEPLGTPDCRGFRPLPGDGWSHHPYSGSLAPTEPDPDPDHVRMGDLPRLAAALDSLAGRFEKQLPIYVTEYGYQTNPPDPTWEHSPVDQARLLEAGERVARSLPEVRSTAQFLLRDLPERPGRTLQERWRDFQSGLYFADGRPKPAVEIYRRLREE